MQYFVAWGINPGRLSAAGHGASMPVAPNDTYEGRTLNRRVQFRVIRTERGDAPTESPSGAGPNPQGLQLGAGVNPQELPTRADRGPGVILASWLNTLLDALAPEAHAAPAGGAAGSSALESGLVVSGQARAASQDDIAVWATTDVLRGDARVLTVIVDEEPARLDRGRAVFHAVTNYPDYIDEWRLDITDAESLAPIARITGPASDLGHAIVWDLRTIEGDLVDSAGRYVYTLTVYDSRGNADRTAPRRLRIEGAAGTGAAASATEGLDEPGWWLGRPAGLAHDRDNLAARSIVIRGGVVTVFGEGIPAESRVTVDGHPIEVDRNGRFAAEFVKPFGSHELEVRVVAADGRKRLAK